MKNIVQAEREQRKMSREELATLVGVSRQTIYFLETDRYNPSIHLAHHLAQIFGKTIEEIFIFEEEEEK